jgi:hypothetical protein
MNLDLCRSHALAGTPNSNSGVWAFVEVKVGDYISFLYGARAYDLYQVERKYALKGAEDLGPWPRITSKESGRSYYFPFRFGLKLVRRFEESLVRREFTYVAENLLLRGGYKKTHFQADQTTLQQASDLGERMSPYSGMFSDGAETFEPVFTQNRSAARPPESYHFSEFILQSLIKDLLQDGRNLDRLIELAPVLKGKPLEILGERALQRGLIDIMVKEATPMGQSNKVVIEVKNRIAKSEDIAQLLGYESELGAECVGMVLAARGFPEKLVFQTKELNIRILNCDLDWGDSKKMKYQELERALRISFV